MFSQIINTLSDLLYTYILIILLLATGIYFTVKTRFVQFRMLIESIRVVMEPKDDEKGLSSFQALMVSTASRVGTGNIAGISTAICLGGAGAVFWMWITALLGSASAFIESTLAQIYKRRAEDGSCYGGPAYYIQAVLKKRWMGVIFAVFLILTYMVGFNLVASFNITDCFRAYGFFDESSTPLVIGGILAVVFCVCICGGSRQISRITGVLVPAMGIFYLALSLFIVVTHYSLIPGMFADIFTNAFDLKAVFGGFTGSCVMQGIKRGLFSNEAGVGSAPNAAASASVSHPVKQGLVQMLSVFIDTILICSATAFMLLCSGVSPSAELKGMPWVQAAASHSLGSFGTVFITVALFLFAFTTLIGNFFYAEMGLGYLCDRKPGRKLLIVFRIVATVIVFSGSLMEFSVAWSTADVIMGFLALINLPVIILLGGPAVRCLKDYVRQKKEGKNPVFKAADIGLKDRTDFWN
ncbi:amino acid carrier protein [Lachnoclostridium sp. An169]|uniref:alanine/glycine:cation symporter family protein n=1 Tax=Lachnoclostridium sp. An169 TaxID=1965569 RepID=UPI000B36E00F|nr:alanine/glycine:cation symporter family protein [Lachnoclostridium sp. An169]OUP83782.1 amino acid carrier protein [Lachnoclostridium sp. An169]HJA66461.1 alanine:cation symporter family protein [Candidatus Mediterraneibacter cottocaccae]